MKNARLLLSLQVLFFCLLLPAVARALDIQPYTAAGLQQAQAEGRPVAVHFHADWCSTCKAQERVFRAIKDDPELKDIALLVASLGHVFLALAAGGLSTLNPCVFPLLPEWWVNLTVAL